MYAEPSILVISEPANEQDLSIFRRELDRLFSDVLRPESSSLHRDPHAETRALWNRVGNLFDNVKGGAAGSAVGAAAPNADNRLAVSDSEWVPNADVKEDANGLEISLDLPGVDMADVKVDLFGQILQIHGEVPRLAKKEGELYHREERRRGKFMRSFRLPGLQLVKPCEVTATFQNGVLTVSVPKRHEKPVSIQIRSGPPVSTQEPSVTPVAVAGSADAVESARSGAPSASA